MTARFRSDSPTVSWTETRQTGSYGVPIEELNSFSTPRSMTDHITPGFFSSKREGKYLTVNPMNSTKKTLDVQLGDALWEDRINATNKDLFTEFGNYGGGVAYFKKYSGHGAALWPSWSGSLVDWPDEGALVVEALARARASGFDIGTFLAEFHKTVRMIASFRDNVMRRAEAIADSLPREDSIQRAIEVFSSTWLEGRYGWRILAYELQSIDEAIQGLKDLSSDYVRKEASETSEATRFIREFDTSPVQLYCTRGYTTSGQFSYGKGMITQDYTKTVKAGVMLDAIADGLAFIDPLVTAWEVVPFSFIVDWFSNIGHNVAAFSPFGTGRLRHAWVVKKSEKVTTTVVFPVIDPTPYDAPTYTGPEEFISVATETTLTRELADPSFNLTFQLNLDGQKLTDLASIFFLRYARLLGLFTSRNRL